MSDSMLGWHFCATNGKTLYNDLAVADGQTLSVKGPVQLCKWGLHASPTIMGALSYAPGPILCRVKLFGSLIVGDDKSVALNRKCLWHLHVQELVADFAKECILKAQEARENYTFASREDALVKQHTAFFLKYAKENLKKSTMNAYLWASYDSAKVIAYCAEPLATWYTRLEKLLEQFNRTLTQQVREQNKVGRSYRNESQRLL